MLAEGTTDAGINIEASGPTTLVFQRVTIQPGGCTGWHTHPGPLLVVVQSGTLTHCNRHCEVRTYTPGQAFEEPGGQQYVHMGANQGGDPVVLDVTYVVPAGGPLRNDVPGPTCAAC